MTELREKSVTTNAVTLHVVETGPKTGPMVLFLHGFPEFWYAWRRQLDYFSQRGYLAVAPDQRGYNLSDKPPGIAPYRVDELARDIVGLIDTYGQEKVFLVGHDWGAAVSWWVALNYPERINRLVIMNCSHPFVFRKHLLGNQRQMEKSWYIFYFQLLGAVEKFAEADDYAWPIRLLVETSVREHSVMKTWRSTERPLNSRGPSRPWLIGTVPYSKPNRHRRLGCECQSPP